MVTASVEVVGAVCRHLSWSAYLYHLKHFIHVLQTGQINQKLGVRYGKGHFQFCVVLISLGQESKCFFRLGWVQLGSLWTASSCTVSQFVLESTLQSNFKCFAVRWAVVWEEQAPNPLGYTEQIGPLYRVFLLTVLFFCLRLHLCLP